MKLAHLLGLFNDALSTRLVVAGQFIRRSWTSREGWGVESVMV
jgi:hypothetical protein